MLAGFQHHFGAAHDSLRGKAVRLCAGHSVGDRRVRHCLDEHEYISRRTAADGYDRVHQILADDLRQSEAAEDFLHVLQLLRGNIGVGGDGGDSRADHGRRIRHGADDLQTVAAEAFRERSKRLSRRDGDDDLITRDDGRDFRDHLRVVLRLHGEDQYLRCFCDLAVVRRDVYAVSFG